MQPDVPFFVTTTLRPFLADLDVRILKYYEGQRGHMFVDLQQCAADGLVRGMCETICLSVKEEWGMAMRHLRRNRVVQLRWKDPRAAAVPTSTWLG